jgi:hypothetical protein
MGGVLTEPVHPPVSVAKIGVDEYAVEASNAQDRELAQELLIHF